MKPKTRATLFIVRWVSIFVGGFAGMIWMWNAAHVQWFVPLLMGTCFGNGVGKLSVADRNRLLRKMQQRTEKS